MTTTIIVGVLAAVLAWGIAAGVRDSRRRSRALVLLRQFNDEALCCLYSSGSRFLVVTINGSHTRRQPFVIAVMPACLSVYSLHGDSVPSLSFTPEQLRWFGRPKKYSYGLNEIWLHAAIDGRWVLLKLWLNREPMQKLVRALKEFATPEQVIAYRRRRPYVHYGPVTVRPAEQDMLGAWTLGDSVALYLMPTGLVLLDGAAVRQVIPLSTIQGVSAIRRAERLNTAGLVRFTGNDKPVAFALKPYEAFASALADAARHTLEDPVEWLSRKKKKGGVADDDEDFA